ncbi:MAG TPA: cupin domain-containing protein [Janthinobacterium sp.]|nr:cupin domain-containing protein [Janthinobacterium sp.]
MKRILIAATVFAFSLPFSARALDNSAMVKVTPLQKTSNSWDGKAVVYPAGQAEVTTLMVELAAGGETGWHEHPVPSFAYVLEGTLEVRRQTGETKIVHTGEMLAEVVNTPHNGRALDGKPVKLLVLYTGSAGGKLSVPHPEMNVAPVAGQ